MKNHYKLGIAVLFAFGSLQAQNYDLLVKNYLNSDPAFRNVKTEQREFRIDTEDLSSSMKATVLKIQQTYKGVPVFSAGASALVKNEQIAVFNENFSRKTAATDSRSGALGKKSVFTSVLSTLGIPASDVGKEAASDGNAKEVYYPTEKELVYAYEYSFPLNSSSDYLHIVANASSGEILYKENLTLTCSFDRQFFGRSHTGHDHTFIGAMNKPYDASNFVAADNATYNVFALPIEAPSFGQRSIVTNPWDLSASRDGWHSDGTNSYTITRGNNVYAYTDLNSTNAIGATADGGPQRNFDFPLDITKHHSTYQDAAITNLFYMNNKMHDISYKFGFTESARNFQTNNYELQGIGKDAVLAEARDGINLTTPNLNNANFSTPADGSAPRMQMYMWNPQFVQRVAYNSPADFVSRKPNSQPASFGPALTPAGVTGDILAPAVKDGCTPLSEDFTGKIALIQRGSCNFTVKVKNAQLKGAIGAIIYNIPGSTFGTMGGTDATVTIPSVLIEQSEGEAILSKLNETAVNVTLSDDKSKYVYIDGDLDNGIIAHEYTHGISNRLTGTGVGCLSATYANEQMGEGWSDFLALMLTNRPGDNASVPRGIGTFAGGEAINGLGIRPRRYSPDFTVNEYTYGKTNGMVTTNALGSTVPDVHSIGFVWATMLWDLHWKYVEKYGYSSNVLDNKDSGSARVLQLVMDGMKLQACYPTFVDGRNALIAADQATTNGEDKCMIWNVFARRGLGLNAKPGLKQAVSTSAANVTAALSDQVEDFNVPEECKVVLATNEIKVLNGVMVYPNPAKTEIYFKSATPMIGKTNISVYDASGKLVLQDKLDISNQSINISTLPNGVYVVKGENLSTKFSQKILVNK